KGYEFDKITEGSAPVEGNITNETQEITFVYKKVRNEQAVIVSFVSQNGKPIIEDEVISGNIGDSYTAEKKDLTDKGYIYGGTGENSATPTETITNKTQKVIYVYKGQKNEKALLLSFVDENGKKIIKDKELDGIIGSSYEVKPTSIMGYKYSKLAD